VNNIEEKIANSIFDILNKFAGYGFNKSHSAAYAILSYQTGFLKANYPVQFMAAMLSSELGNSEKVSHFVAECEAMGLKVLGPDVNESREMFTPVFRKKPSSAVGGVPSPRTSDSAPSTESEAAIRFGLAGVKGVGELAAQKIIVERDAKGPYASFEDFCSRVDGRAINKRVLEHLSKTGAFDFSGALRKKLFDSIDGAMATASNNARDKAAGQHSFMDMLAEAPAPLRPALNSQLSALSSAAAAADDFTSAERLIFEKELLGFYVSGHPMNVYSGLTEAIDTFAVDDLLKQGDRIEFRLAGIASNIVKRLSKKDNRPWAMFTLATKNASVALNLFADGYAAYGAILAENAPILVQGNIITGTEGPRINVKECYALENEITRLVKKVTWLVNPTHPELTGFLRLLRETLNKQVGDTRVEFAFLFEKRVAPYAEASTALTWKLNGPSFQMLRSHPAVVGVQIQTRALELKQDRKWSKKS
jgi:DNA polymerase-3 subunit alpha